MTSRSRRAALLASLLVALAASAASAQGVSAPSAPSPRWQIVAGIGYGGVADDEGSLGKGIEFSAGVGRRLNQTWTLEGIVSRHAHERRDAFRVDADATAFIGRLVVNLGDEASPARFFVGAGVGAIRHTGTVGFAGGAPGARIADPRAPYSVTGLVSEVGVGIDIAAGPRWFIRPEVRGRWSSVERPTFGPEPPYLSWLASVALGWRP